MSLHSALQDLEYPCDYPFKLICAPDAAESVRACILSSLGDDAVITDVHQRASRSGRYIALTVIIQAVSSSQIEQVYEALKTASGIITSL